MKKNRTLFDDNVHVPASQPAVKIEKAAVKTRHQGAVKKEVSPVERLKNLEGKIANAIDKVKLLKEEKITLERRIKELESKLDAKTNEIEALKSEKTAIKSQVEGLLSELDELEVV